MKNLYGLERLWLMLELTPTEQKEPQELGKWIRIDVNLCCSICRQSALYNIIFICRMQTKGSKAITEWMQINVGEDKIFLHEKFLVSTQYYIFIASQTNLFKCDRFILCQQLLYGWKTIKAVKILKLQFNEVLIISLAEKSPPDFWTLKTQ